MLPSRDFLKEQVNRLISYMGEKHRFRLRPASAMEAVAAMYRQPDWNTLQALAARGEQPKPAQTGAAVAHYPLDWGAYGPRLYVSRNDWQRHVLAEGGTAKTRRAWLQRHLAGQLLRGGAGVFVNVFGGTLSTAERSALEERSQVLDLAHGHGPACNALAEMPVGLAAEMVMAALTSRLSADVFWYARIKAAVTTVLMVSQAVGARVTLSHLSFDLRQLGLDGGKALLASAPQGEPRAAALALFDALGGDNGKGAVSLKKLLVEVAQDLEDWQRTPGVQRLFSDSATAPSLLSMMQAPHCLIVEMAAQNSERAVRLQGAVLQCVVREASSRACELPREAREPHPRVIALSEGHRYLVPAFRLLVEQGRAAGWTALLTIPDSDSLRTIPDTEFGVTGNVWNKTALSLVANVWNRMYLGGVPPQVLEDVIARMQAADAVVVSPNGVQFGN